MKSASKMPLVGAMILIVIAVTLSVTAAGCGNGSDPNPGNTGGSGGGSTGGSGGSGGTSGGKIASLTLSFGGKTLGAGDTVWVRETDIAKITAAALDTKGSPASMASLMWKDDGSGVVSVKPGVPTADVTGMKNLCTAGTMPKDPRSKVTATVDGMSADVDLAIAFNMKGSWKLTRDCGAVGIFRLNVTEQIGSTISKATQIKESITADFAGTLMDGHLSLEYTEPASGNKYTIVGNLGCDKTFEGKYNTGGPDCTFYMQPIP